MQKKSPQMIYCLTFENNAKKKKKKKYRGPYVFWLFEAILHAWSILSSHLAMMSLLPHFLPLHNNCSGWPCCSALLLGGNEAGRRNRTSWLRGDTSMCAWIVNLVVMATWGCESGITKGIQPPDARGQCSLHQQCLAFTVRYGCLKVFTLGKHRVRPTFRVHRLHRGTITAWKQAVCVFVWVCVHVQEPKQERDENSGRSVTSCERVSVWLWIIWCER